MWEREREGRVRFESRVVPMAWAGACVVVDKEKKGVGMGSVGSPSLWYFKQHTKQGACVCTVLFFVCARAFVRMCL